MNEEVRKMGKDYSVGLMKMVKMAKNNDRQARLLLAMTDLTRVLGTIDPENATENGKQKITAAFISNAGASTKTAGRNIRKVTRELTIIRRWLREAEAG